MQKREPIHDTKQSWVLVISGFTQRLGAPNGCQRLWARLHREFSQEGVVILPLVWNADWRGVAELIHQTQNCTKPTVIVAAYSWGAGWGFRRLSAELQKREIGIAESVLCDPVYRPRLWLLSWMALIPCLWFKVLQNVRSVAWFYQRTGPPMGHKPIAIDPSVTHIDEGIELPPGVPHAFADDSRLWHEAVMDACRRFL